jgi:hypothetical protein
MLLIMLLFDRIVFQNETMFDTEATVLKENFGLPMLIPLGGLYRNHEVWRLLFPKVKPYFVS